MGKKDNPSSILIQQLGLVPFRERLPWLGGDLQTLRDTLWTEKFPHNNSRKIEINVPAANNGINGKGSLLGLLDFPKNIESPIKGLVILIHGLGGSSKRQGLMRMAKYLQEKNFATLRLNLRGADPCRHIIPGTYSAKCNSDINPVLIRARKICKELSNNENPIPLFGVGISLGGTIFLNACLDAKYYLKEGMPALDGLVCTSSPLDLNACSNSIERSRNKIYQAWLLKRLIRQTLEDPFTNPSHEKEKSNFIKRINFAPKNIREYDDLITAKRWGYKNVDDYYLNASPLPRLLKSPNHLPPTLLLQAKDDPWVPAKEANELSKKLAHSNYSNIKVILTKNGGHNGFHGVNGCWGDQLVTKWFEYLLEYQ